MVGKTLTTLKRNCLEPMQAIIGADNMRFSIPAKRAVIFGRKVDLEGASDARSEEKIRGITLHGAYMDEITLAPEEFFVMLLSRLSTEGARLFGTTNPDSPRHWLKTEYLDNSKIDLYKTKFLLDDNTTLPREYVENLKKEYTGVFYRRFILGEWVAAEGAIYPMFDVKRHVSEEMPKMKMTWISADIGHTNPTAFLRLGVGTDGKIWVSDEFYHRAGNDSLAKSPKQYASDMTRFAKAAERIPDVVVVDPAAEGFILQLKEDAPMLRIKRADNAVLEGIQLVSSAIDADVIRIHPRCRNTIDELQGYSWDPKAQLRGEDKPVKVNDHTCDALRYGLMAYKREITRMVMDCGRNQQTMATDRLAMVRL